MTQETQKLIIRTNGVGKDSKIVWACGLAEKYFGFDPAGKTLSDVFDNIEDNNKKAAAVLKDGIEYYFESFEIGCGEYLFKPACSSGKDRASASLAIKDMVRSQENLFQTQKIAGIGGFEYLPDEEMIVLSEAACDVLGIECGKLAYSVHDFCKRLRKGKNDQFCVLLSEASQNNITDTSFIFKDDSGEFRHIDVFIRKSPFTVKGSISGVFHNVTRRRQAEIARKNQSEEFETVFYKTRMAILVMNLKGRIVDFNDSAAKLFGYNRKEMQGMRSVKLLLEDDLEEALGIFGDFINSAGKQNLIEYRMKKKNGDVVDVLANFEMIIGDQGEKIYVFLNDISKIKMIEQKSLDQERMLIQQSKMATLGEMVALIAHQWQQPVNSIAMIVQMLEELIDVDEENRKMLSKSVQSVMDQINFMSATINDFRSFLKPNNSKEPFNLLRTVREVVELYRPQLKYYDVKCDVFVEDESLKKVKVLGYENELKNVILNFLTNARDAVESSNISNGNIEVVLSDEGDKVKISVEDNGGGMPKEVMKKIFSPYVTTKGEKGTGLGLYMTKLIINDRMNGQITMSNTDTGLRINVLLDKYKD